MNPMNLRGLVKPETAMSKAGKHVKSLGEKVAKRGRILGWYARRHKGKLAIAGGAAALGGAGYAAYKKYGKKSKKKK